MLTLSGRARGRAGGGFFYSLEVAWKSLGPKSTLAAKIEIGLPVVAGVQAMAHSSRWDILSRSMVVASRDDVCEGYLIF